jgi:hypothetical protein
MSRVSKAVLLAGLVIGTVIGASGCTVQASVKTKTRFNEPNVAPASTPTDTWNGEKITINAQGVGVAVNGGIAVVVDPSATMVTAVADMVALANDDDRASADQSIADAKATFTIAKDGNGWTVSCGHGGSHGSSDSGSSGCNKVTVTIPAGDATKKIALDALSGNGEVNIDISSVTLASLGVNGKGDITVRAPTTQGSTISVVAENGDDINLLLPSSFAADKIELFADADKIMNHVGDLSLTDETGGKTGSRGTAGEGALSVKATSKDFAGTTGQVMLSTF